jgi:PadR family transcriptional regulator, regulatory protein PadR
MSGYPYDTALDIEGLLYIGTLYTICMISSNIKRGSAELAILSVLADRPLHGYEIARRIERQTQGTLHFTLASLYPLLYRMESRGWLRAAWSETAAGRPRRCYRLTAAGRRKLAPLRKEWKELFRALGRLAEAHHA